MTMHAQIFPCLSQIRAYHNSFFSILICLPWFWFMTPVTTSKLRIGHQNNKAIAWLFYSCNDLNIFKVHLIKYKTLGRIWYDVYIFTYEYILSRYILQVNILLKFKVPPAIRSRYVLYLQTWNLSIAQKKNIRRSTHI